MSALSAAEQGARAAERFLFHDTCAITRAGSELVYDEATDSYVTPTITVREGACRLKYRDNASRTVEAAGQSVSLLPYILSVPLSWDDVQEDDIATMIGSTRDPQIVGMVLRVKEVPTGDTLTTRRLGCEVQA